jgi:hypothetical protein
MESTGIVCANCDALQDQIKFKGCGNCRTVHYCCPECQKHHWKFHKIICKSILNYADGDRKKAREISKKNSQVKGQLASSLAEIRSAIELKYDQDHARIIFKWKSMTQEARFALVNELAIMPSKRGEKRVFRTGM